MKKIAIVVPCYNEEKRIFRQAFIDYAERNPNVSIYFYNDGSSDKTLEVIMELSQKGNNIFYIDGGVNKGKAEGVRSALLNIYEQKLGFDYYGFIDADLAAPLEEINNLATYFSDEKKIISGARVKMIGRDIVRSMFRHYVSRGFVTYYSSVLNLPNYDTQCGLKFFSNDVVAELFKQPFISKWLFDLELFIRAKALFQQNYIHYIVEVPLNKWHEIGGSKIKASTFLKAPFEVLKMRAHYS